jgi:NAD(P)-dependent dehydrogenase (short-subunit alcohol dehydrogenase family)
MKRAILTGATSGIGEAIARRLPAQDMTVVLIGRGDDRLAMARRRIVAPITQADLRPKKCDLSLLADVRELAGRLTEQPAPDVLISCASDRTGHRSDLRSAAPHLGHTLTW